MSDQPDRKSKRRTKSEEKDGFWKAAVGTGVLTAAVAALLYGRRGAEGGGSGAGRSAAGGTGKKFAALLCVLLICIVITGVVFGIRLSRYFTEWDSDVSIDLTANPGMVMDDGSTVISDDTQIDLFRVTYTGEGNRITVAGRDGDRVIAPGTDGEFVFRLKNTGDAELLYSVALHAYISVDSVELPVEVCLKGADGQPLVGGADGWADAAALDGVADQGSIEAHGNIAYTLGWRWPFEGGSDALDTALGNLADGQDVTLSLTVHTLAMLPAGEAPGGFAAALNRILPWLLGVLLALLILGVVILARYRRAERRNRE